MSYVNDFNLALRLKAAKSNDFFNTILCTMFSKSFLTILLFMEKLLECLPSWPESVCYFILRTNIRKF